MDFLQIVKEHEKEILTETKNLLKIPSVLTQFDAQSETPFGENINNALKFMLELGKRDGFLTKNIDNYAGHIEAGNGKEILGVLCHLDVVPAGDGWSHDPYDPIIKDNKLYARGTTDDKGPTMAAYFALKLLNELDDVKFNKRIRIILGTDEETAWRGIERYLNKEQMPDIGFAPDAMFPLIYAEKGLFSFTIEGTVSASELITFKAGDRENVVPDYAECTLNVDLEEAFEKYLAANNLEGQIEDNKYIVHGKRAHAMQPNLGVNAAFLLADFLNEHINNEFLTYMNKYLTFDYLGKKLNIDFYDEEMKEFTMNPGVFNFENNTFSIDVNCRYPQNWPYENAKKAIEKSVEKFKFDFRETTHKVVHYVDKESDLVQTLMASYKKYTLDETGTPITIGGGTYARSLEKGVAFGPVMPGREEVAHQLDEYIYIEDLLKATAIYMDAIYNLTR
ncbi:MAG: dipeptidase PepV [Candidatus Izimaplasma sp.]|nr:dipeptidase PepV [Candidatus Izimaplasma bacterium]